MKTDITIREAETLYDVLGMVTTASIAEIKSQFRKISKIAHPDKGGDEEYYKPMSVAFNILRNVDKKAEYDKVLNYDPNDAWQFFEKEMRRQYGPFVADNYGKIAIGVLMWYIFLIWLILLLFK